MKNRASGLVKRIITGLSSMAKAKTVSLRTKASAIKARLIIFSLLRNKKFLISSLSEKLHSVLGQNSNANEECFLEDGTDQSKATVVYTDNAHAYEALPNPSDTQVVEDRDRDEYESYYRYEEEEDKYPDLTHTLFESEDLDFGGSVIDMVKNSKEEAGEEFKMEDEIDHMADLFIRRFRKQIILQKQESLKRNLEMLQNGA
ncbi:hypothetical protein QN277_020853 [Acacia crassicarpa]|uniref:Uncharacterized protein n=1 Tax=Acacia crassicarpa TaxID=499986 RepID=A0AAE1JKM8_9FABA|nr:hypothetical protein QN277_020853 [Acacia crassicarpa]